MKRIIIAGSVVVAIVLFLILRPGIVRNIKYNKAVKLLESGEYDSCYEAWRIFIDLDGYKDSEAQLEKCRSTVKNIEYNEGKRLYYSGKYEEALKKFQSANRGVGDSEINEWIKKCKNMIND